ncbi:MAG: hypothetical protein KDA28_13995 [Phycisphaerales bacterium]|nr:hypothetical protein [Phycisphaerales bacterium]
MDARGDEQLPKDRHDGAINISYIDGHAATARLDTDGLSKVMIFRN